MDESNGIGLNPLSFGIHPLSAGINPNEFPVNIKMEPHENFYVKQEPYQHFQIKQEPPNEFHQWTPNAWNNQIKMECNMGNLVPIKQEIPHKFQIKQELGNPVSLKLEVAENKPIRRTQSVTSTYTEASRISVVQSIRMSRRGNWNRAFYKNNNYRGRPQGLRGKNIGLYYRDLQMKKNKNKDQDFMINFAIPPGILNSLQKNIESIKKIAKECNINIQPPRRMNLVNIKQEQPSEYECSTQVDNFPVNNFMKLPRETSSFERPGTSSSSNVVEPMNQESETVRAIIKAEPTNEPEVAQSSHSSDIRMSALQGAGDYKYGYADIITGTFEEKLEQCISKGIIITMENSATQTLNTTFYENYKNMINSKTYKKMKVFREILPTYKKSKELLEVINNNQVVVISGETGCGKSTQIPQIILDDAIVNNRGANVHILVTQPRRIAASSLAMRVAEERSERIGESIGYAVRLETIEPRPRGSIKFCTTGILLAELEVNQGLTNYSHVILDEVHERDCHIDISMLMLKQVLKKRKDLKLILMSATIDAEKLQSYFDDCPMMHIEGLAYPVQDIYLEDILSLIKYIPPVDQGNNQNVKIWQRQKMKRQEAEMQRDIQYKAEIAPWLESIRKNISRDVYVALQDSKIEDLNIDLIYELLVYICKDAPGAVLIFLPGIGDITKLLKKINTSNFFPKSLYDIYPLHSKLPSLEQHKIFQRPPENVRKIILATNIAETSITIDDIVYVIDCGKIKYSGLNIEDNIPTLQTEWVSQANLRQRRGRAGRCQPGVCYHLVTSFRASKLAERLLPEIQRNSLAEPVLAIKRLRLGKAVDAMSMMPSPPAVTTTERAVRHLFQIGALNSEEKLTPLGWHLARLPVHPAAGKLLLLGTIFGCLNRAASVAAVWGFKDPFQLVIGKEKEVDEAKRTLALGEPSDHVAISEAIIQFEQCRSYQEKRNFAYENFLAFNTLELLCDMKKQFGDNLKQMGFLQRADVTSDWENRNMNNMSLFKAIIAASLYPNIATVGWRQSHGRNPQSQPRLKVRTSEDGPIAIHPSSVMAYKMHGGQRFPMQPACITPGANWLVYWLKQRSSDLFLIDVTLIYTLPFLFFGELVVSEAPDPSDYCVMISNVKVNCKKSTMDLLWQMRSLLDQVLASKIGDSSKQATLRNPFENQVFDAVMELITAEDERAEYIADDDDSESDTSEFYSNRYSWRR
ncbi:ATP-dependent DNA/RNA helicase DHX36-like isoform X1 [Helicoverpa zea]|uniref:ATP-dependent DNA/RNA helicase DHX36-like isoform X1 n=2 Tax=Helicoverpa zea TaxID=7113 RepID=UPI001F5A3614|nr:ATP-dependent DNA/RNA helicase DHX36-like isoform X1 [Helicoverpa zea]